MSHIQRACELEQAFVRESANSQAPFSSLDFEISRIFEQRALRWRGGFVRGSLIEWGIPYGLDGRSVPVGFLAHVTQSERQYALWVECERKKNQFHIYPPRFAAEGVALDRLLFVSTNNPISELKPVFSEPVFQMIILNDPQFFTKEDMMFLRKKAKQLLCVIFVLRPFLLTVERGNVWAQYRINVRNSGDLDFIKGGRCRVPCDL